MLAPQRVQKLADDRYSCAPHFRQYIGNNTVTKLRIASIYYRIDIFTVKLFALAYIIKSGLTATL
jgi:hypothetical protein